MQQKICFVLFSEKKKTHFASLQTVFNYSEVSLCFSYFFFMWSQFDIYWYILEAGDFCSFMSIFIVRGGGRGKCPWGVMSYTRIQGGGLWTGGLFSLLPPLFSFLTPLFALLPPLVSLLPPLLFSFLPATLSFLPRPLSFLPSIVSFLPPPFSFLPPSFSPAPSTLSAPTFL